MEDFANGHLVLLNREAAKDFFGCREDAVRLKFLDQLVADPNTIQVDCRGNWEALHDAFSSADVEDSILGQCVLGGRPLHQGDDFHVCLVRPDVVRGVANQCDAVDVSGWGDLAKIGQEVADLYRTSAQSGAAVVFVAKRAVDR